MKAGGRVEEVSTTSIAREVGVEPATVTETIQNLSEKNMLEHEPYQRIHLTEKDLQRREMFLGNIGSWNFSFHESFGYMPEELC